MLVTLPWLGSQEAALLVAPIASLTMLGLLDELVPRWRSGSGSRLRSWMLAAFISGALLSVASSAVAVRRAPSPVRRGAWSGAEESAAIDRLRAVTPRSAWILHDPGLGWSVAAGSGRRSVITDPTTADARLVRSGEAVLSARGECALTRADLDRLFSVQAPWPPSVVVLARRPAGAPPCHDLPSGAIALAEEPGFGVYHIANPYL
jgi:hypothetical protein